MMKEQTVLGAVFINVVLGSVWHLLTFIICTCADNSCFCPEKKLYKAHKWERNGKIYSDVLKINKWKDLLPKHTGKDGFCKDHLEKISLPYLDEFIMETCRAEWDHTMNCLYSVVLFIINDIIMAAVLTLVLFFLNLPFVVIQRYNRFRLQKLRDVIQKKSRSSESRTVLCSGVYKK